MKNDIDLGGCGPISANLFVANLTQILYKYGACLVAANKACIDQRGAEGPDALQVLLKAPMIVSDHLFTPGGTGSVPSHKSVSPYNYNKEKIGTARRPSLPEKRH